MDRRKFIVAAGTVSLAGCLGGNKEVPENKTQPVNREPVDSEEVTNEAKKVKRLAGKFHDEMSKYFDELSVFIRKNGEIIMEYTTDKKSSEALKTEIHNIAEEFVELIETEKEITNLTIITGKVQAIVAEIPIKKYYNGELEQNAFHETIEVISVER